VFVGLVCAFGCGLIMEEMGRASLKIASLPQSFSLFEFVDDGEVSDYSVHSILVKIILDLK
jgi:hypothetical protein